MDSPRILIAEDEPAVGKLLARCCHQVGFETTLVEDGVEALALAQSNSYHLIITDYQMPRMDGIQLCRQLRRCEQHTRTPIIVCSAAVAQLDTEALQREMGAIDFIAKPVDLLNFPELFRDAAKPPNTRAQTGF